MYGHSGKVVSPNAWTVVPRDEDIHEATPSQGYKDLQARFMCPPKKGRLDDGGESAGDSNPETGSDSDADDSADDFQLTDGSDSEDDTINNPRKRRRRASPNSANARGPNQEPQIPGTPAERNVPNRTVVPSPTKPPASAALTPHSTASARRESGARTKGEGKAIGLTEGDHDSPDHEGKEKKPPPTSDLVSLTAQIRIFVNDLGRPTMDLPPMGAESRTLLHQIAAAFKLESKSVGKRGNRRIKLTRTSSTGIDIREDKITSILKPREVDVPITRAQDRKLENIRSRGHVRHKEGDIVGQKAAKIDEGNVGFKLLQRMGYGVSSSHCHRGILIFILS